MLLLAARNSWRYSALTLIRISDTNLGPSPGDDLSNRHSINHWVSQLFQTGHRTKDVVNSKSHFSKGKQALTTYVPEIEIPKKQVQDLQEERCKSKGDQSGLGENYLKGQAHTTRVDTLDRSPNTRGANSRSRSRVTDDPAVRVQEKLDTQDCKIFRRRMEFQ
ncbi:hypothetical protein TNCV_318931 [Trichonephila clavipes]|nr:hypothetical protein TNCV_318931 [Trichonephila clavipes]